jgi:hypothetical protein
MDLVSPIVYPGAANSNGSYGGVAAVGATADRYYAAGAVNCTALTALTLTANQIYAVPWLPQRSGIIDRLAFNVTTAVANNAVMGLYANAAGSLYPGALLVAGTPQSTGTIGAKLAAISQSIIASQIYWLVINAGAAIGIRAIPFAAVPPILGISDALGTSHATCALVARAYDGTLPSLFPSGATLPSVVAPGLFFRWAS